MLKTRDKALISLTALFQAALGIFGFLRMLVRKEIFCNENDFPALVWALVLLFVVTFAFAVIMRDLPSKTYVIPAFSMPMIFLIAGFLGTACRRQTHVPIGIVCGTRETAYRRQLKQQRTAKSRQAVYFGRQIAHNNRENNSYGKQCRLELWTLCPQLFLCFSGGDRKADHKKCYSLSI